MPHTTLTGHRAWNNVHASLHVPFQSSASPPPHFYLAVSSPDYVDIPNFLDIQHVNVTESALAQH